MVSRNLAQSPSCRRTSGPTQVKLKILDKEIVNDFHGQISLIDVGAVKQIITFLLGRLERLDISIGIRRAQLCGDNTELSSSTSTALLCSIPLTL